MNSGLDILKFVSYPFIMNAIECRKLSKKNKPIIDRQNRAFEQRERDRINKETSSKRTRFYNKLKQECEKNIKYAIENGETSCYIYLKSFDYDDMKNFPQQIEKVIEEYKNKGFNARQTTITEYHDDTVAYMNSGGECGSSEPYYTNEDVVEISW